MTSEMTLTMCAESQDWHSVHHCSEFGRHFGCLCCLQPASRYPLTFSIPHPFVESYCHSSIWRNAVRSCSPYSDTTELAASHTALYHTRKLCYMLRECCQCWFDKFQNFRYTPRKRAVRVGLIKFITLDARQDPVIACSALYAMFCTHSMTQAVLSCS